MRGAEDGPPGKSGNVDGTADGKKCAAAVVVHQGHGPGVWMDSSTNGPVGGKVAITGGRSNGAGEADTFIGRLVAAGGEAIALCSSCAIFSIYPPK